MLLQETPQNKIKKEIIKHPMLGELSIANGTNKARGVAIIFMKNSKFDQLYGRPRRQIYYRKRKSGGQTINSWFFSCSPSCSSGSDPVCSEAELEAAESRGLCGLITDGTGPFRECHRALDPTGHFASCVYDQCALSLDPDSLCRSLQSYADACRSLGAPIEPWRNATFCRECGGRGPVPSACHGSRKREA